MHVRKLTEMTNRTGIALALACALAGFFLIATNAQAANGGAAPDDGPAKATVKIRVLGLKNHQATVMNKVTVKGSLKPFRNLQKVKVYFYKDGKRFSTRTVKVHKAGKNYGTFTAAIRMRGGNRYGVRAKYWGKAGKKAVGKDTTDHKSWRSPASARR